jgi:hypothetical protein
MAVAERAWRKSLAGVTIADLAAKSFGGRTESDQAALMSWLRP